MKTATECVETTRVIGCEVCLLPMQLPEPDSRVLAEKFHLCDDHGYADEDGFYGWGPLPGESDVATT